MQSQCGFKDPLSGPKTGFCPRSRTSIRHKMPADCAATPRCYLPDALHRKQRAGDIDHALVLVHCHFAQRRPACSSLMFWWVISTLLALSMVLRSSSVSRSDASWRESCSISACLLANRGQQRFIRVVRQRIVLFIPGSGYASSR